jgi:hypothetical protein
MQQWHRDCIAGMSVHRMMGELVNSRISSEGAYLADHRPPVRTLAKRTLRVPPLIKVLILSLGLWAAIWAALASFASGVWR